MIQSRPVTRGARYSPRRHALQRHGLPLALVGVLAFGGGVVVGAGHEPAGEQTAERYATAWQRGDFVAMYALLTDDARARTSLSDFRAAHERLANTATATGLRRAGEAEQAAGSVRVPLRLTTRIFGDVRGTLDLRVAEDDGETRIAWAPHLAFPGLREGEDLTRRTRLPPRATLLAADGTVLAKGEGRTPEDVALAASIRGEMGPIPAERAEELRAAGVPDGAQVGISGLERALDDELRGKPGGELLAGERVIAAAEPRRAKAVRSSIAPSLQRAAVQALAGRLGGAVAIDPQTGQVQAAAGIGLSGLQPPGSTFKIITLAAALRHKVVKVADGFPVETATTLEGVRLENANGESCGGRLIATFAHSCNTVFAPVGARVGARRLVATAEDFGFNAPAGIDGAAESTLPPAGEIGDDLAVGSTAIGQGRVQATALQMALVAATIARDGERPLPTLLADGPARAVPAIPRGVARTIARGMRAVVEEGTGKAAAIPGGRVAGKTGTAELRSTVPPPIAEDGVAVTPDPESDPTDTTAWFAAYAPAPKPRVAVGLFLTEAGAGGTTAAPAARTIIQAALAR